MPPEEQQQLPLSMVNDDHAPPSAETVTEEARRRFVLPPEGEQTATPAPAEDKGGEGAPAEPKPDKEGETAEATQAESEAEKPTETPPEKPGETDEQREKRREARRFERRLDKARRREATALAQAEALARENEELRRKAIPEDTEGMPKIEDFDYDGDKYGAAMRDWTEKRVTARIAEQQRNQTAEQMHGNLMSKWEQATEAASDKFEDFAEVVGELQPNSPMAIAIMESENGPEVAYHLAKNVKEFERIAALPPVSQVREIGRLEAKLLAPAVETPPTPSKAPAPTEPVSTGPAVKSDVPSEEDDFGTWMRKRQKQVHGDKGIRR